jgi:hypothetical protein
VADLPELAAMVKAGEVAPDAAVYDHTCGEWKTAGALIAPPKCALRDGEHPISAIQTKRADKRIFGVTGLVLIFGTVLISIAALAIVVGSGWQKSAPRPSLVQPSDKTPQVAIPATARAGSPSGLASDGNVWVDPSTGLMWQVWPTGGELNWSAAKSHCEKLSLGGYSDWRLPTISELRSLVRGCPATQKGGACKVTDSCLTVECFVSDDNNSPCVDAGSFKGGPGPEGAFWPPEILGEASKFWTSSLVKASDMRDAWEVWFNLCIVSFDAIGKSILARCTRSNSGEASRVQGIADNGLPPWQNAAASSRDAAPSGKQLSEKAHVCFKQKNYGCAFDLFRQASEAEPTKAEHFGNAGFTLYQEKDYPGCISWAENGLGKNGTENQIGTIYFLLASCQREIGEREKACSNYEKSLTLRPNNKLTKKRCLEMCSSCP